MELNLLLQHPAFEDEEVGVSLERTASGHDRELHIQRHIAFEVTLTGCRRCRGTTADDDVDWRNAG